MSDRKPLLTPRNPVKSRAGQKGAHRWRSNFKLKGSATDGVRKPPTTPESARVANAVCRYVREHLEGGK